MSTSGLADFRTLMEKFDGSLSQGVELSEALVEGHDLGNHRGTARLLIIKAMRAAYLRGFQAGRAK